jgi:hypothetical protein
MSRSWYLCETLLEWLPPGLQDVAAARGPSLQGGYTVEPPKTSPAGEGGRP